MLRLPTHPRIAHMLLEAKYADAADDMELALATDIAALLEERDPLPKGSGADLSLRIELLRKWRKGENVPGEIFLLDRIERLAMSWRKLFRIRVDNRPVSDTQVGKWVMAAYPERIGRQVEKHSERYKMVNGRLAKLPDHDPLHREVIHGSVDQTGADRSRAVVVINGLRQPPAQEFHRVGRRRG